MHDINIIYNRESGMAAKYYSVDDVAGLMDKADEVIDRLVSDMEMVEEFCFDGSNDEFSDMEF